MPVLDDTALRRLIRDELCEVLREELIAMGGGPPPPTSNYLSPKQAAALAGTSVSTIHSWRRQGRLKTYRAGRLVRVRRDELEALMAGQSASETPDSNARAAAIIKKGRR